MFGVRPTLEVKGKRKYKSCWGATISMIAFLYIIVYLFGLVLELLKMTLDGQDFIEKL